MAPFFPLVEQLPFSYGICLLLSLIGWGKFLNHILFRNQRTDWGQRAAWGLAFSLITHIPHPQLAHTQLGWEGRVDRSARIE